MSDVLYGGSGPLGELDKRLRVVEKREAPKAPSGERLDVLEARLRTVGDLAERVTVLEASVAAVKSCSCKPPVKPKPKVAARKAGS